MASYRPFPPQTSFAPAPIQNPLPPPQPQPPPPLHPPHQRAQYNQNWGGYGGGGGGADGSISSAPPPPSSSYPQNYNATQMHPNSNYHHQHYVPPRGQQPPPPPPHQQYPYPPPPPPPESSYPPPPPPPPPAPSMAQNSMNVQPPQAPIYYPSNQYSQYSHPPIQPMRPPPPPPPPSSPPNSSIPPPPPPSSPPPPPLAPLQNKEGGVDRGSHERDKGSSKELTASGRHGLLNLVPAKQQQKPPVPPVPVKKFNGPPGRVETEEERRLRKKREFEKQKQEEKQRQQLKESQNTVLQKTQMLSSAKVHGSIVGSRMGDRRATPLLSGERVENRLKKPTTFLCKLKFRNELPDPSAQPKLMAMKNEKDQYTKYTITSLEKTYKPKLFVEPDLGIPLDLLDLSVYNPPSARPPLAPEDEELLHDDVAVTPVKNNGIRRKERPTDKGVAWLVKTQYISPLSMESTKQSLTEKQAKDLREMKGGRNILENRNNRERQIKEIESSFVACKSHPVHATNKDLYPLEVLPLLPDFDRYDDQFVVSAFDSAPTADSEVHSKLDQTVRDAYESQAIMKSYVATSSDTDKSFLAYMVPAPDELSKNIYDEREDISYSWVREYHYDFRLDDVDDPTTYLVSFDEAEARYVPLPTKLVLRKKRAKEGRSSDEVEYFPVPSRVTVRRRSAVAAVELRDSEVYSNSKGSFSNSKRGGLDIEDGLGRPQKVARHQDIDQSSGAEDELSD